MKRTKSIVNKIINKIKNYHPSKWEAFSFLLIPILVGILYSTRLDTDTWFILNYGRYILNHGFPNIDPFTIHEGLNLVIQQWAVDVLFYKVYELFGNIGLYLIVNLVNIYILFITYQLLMLVTDKKRNLSVLFAIIIVSLFDMWFLTSRPQIFSAALLLTELYLLEKYTKTQNTKILFGLPILSILMINFHASMWLMLFCFWLPFFINTFKFRIGNVISEGGKKKDLIIFMLLMVIVGFFNPYGIKAMTYVLTSYNVPYIYNLVGEMKIPDIHYSGGIFVFSCIFLVYVFYILIIKKQIKIYHFLLILGTTYLALSSYRGISFFIISSIYSLTFYLKDNFYYINEPLKNTKMKFFFCGCIIIFAVVPFYLMVINNKTILPTKDSIDYLVEKEDINKIRLYCSYEKCNYAQYLGIKVYTDSRAEIFLEANNHKEDILKELYYLHNNKLNIAKFLEKYNFTHLLVNKNDSLYKYLLSSHDYEIIYKDDIEYSNNDNSENNMYESYSHQEILFKKINK